MISFGLGGKSNKLLVYLSPCTGPVYEMMGKCGLREKPDGSINFFPTINDAVHQATDHISTISVITGTI